MEAGFTVSPAFLFEALTDSTEPLPFRKFRIFSMVKARCRMNRRSRRRNPKIVRPKQPVQIQNSRSSSTTGGANEVQIRTWANEEINIRINSEWRPIARVSSYPVNALVIDPTSRLPVQRVAAGNEAVWTPASWQPFVGSAATTSATPSLYDVPEATWNLWATPPTLAQLNAAHIALETNAAERINGNRLRLVNHPANQAHQLYDNGWETTVQSTTAGGTFYAADNTARDAHINTNGLDANQSLIVDKRGEYVALVDIPVGSAFATLTDGTQYEFIPSLQAIDGDGTVDASDMIANEGYVAGSDGRTIQVTGASDLDAIYREEEFPPASGTYAWMVTDLAESGNAHTFSNQNILETVAAAGSRDEILTAINHVVNWGNHIRINATNILTTEINFTNLGSATQDLGNRLLYLPANTGGTAVISFHASVEIDAGLDITPSETKTTIYHVENVKGIARIVDISKGS